MATETTASRNKRSKTNEHDCRDTVDWSGMVFDGDLLRAVCAFLSFRDCCRAARTCTSFARLFKTLLSHPPTLHRWFAAHPCLSRILKLEPPTYLYDGEDGNEMNYVGDMIYLGVFLHGVAYPVEEMERIVKSQEAYPWYDDDAREKMRLLPSGRTDTDLAKMLRSSADDTEILLLWVAAAGLPNPQLQAALDRHGEMRTTETRGFGSYRIHLDGQNSDTRIPHVEFVGQPHPSPLYGTVEFFYEDNEEAFDLSPFLLLACSRAQLQKRVHPENSDETRQEEEGGAALPTFSDQQTTITLDQGICVVDAEMMPRTGSYSVLFQWETLLSHEASVGVVCDPADPKAKRRPRPFEEWTEDLIGGQGELPGSRFLHEVMEWNPNGGLLGTTVESGPKTCYREQFPVRGYAHSDGAAPEQFGMMYDSDEGKVLFVVNGIVQPIVLPVESRVVGKMRFCARGRDGDKISLLRFVRERLWM